MASKPYELQYAQQAVEDIRALRAYDQRKIVVAIETHLSHTPTQVSRTSIKRMVQPFWSQFRLRAEDFRVYYDVDETSRVVSVLRVLKKGTAETPKGSSHEDD